MFPESPQTTYHQRQAELERLKQMSLDDALDMLGLDPQKVHTPEEIGWKLNIFTNERLSKKAGASNEERSRIDHEIAKLSIAHNVATRLKNSPI